MHLVVLYTIVYFFFFFIRNEDEKPYLYKFHKNGTIVIL